MYATSHMNTISLKHSIDGRLRLKLSAVKNTESTASAVEQILLSHKAVVECNANHITGSVIIKYNPNKASDETFLELLKKEEFYEGEPQWEDSPQKSTSSYTTGAAEVILTKAIEIAAERAILALL